MIQREAVPGTTSALGHTIGAARRRRAATDPEYGRAYDALTVARQVAYQVLEYRLDQGLRNRPVPVFLRSPESRVVSTIPP